VFLCVCGYFVKMLHPTDTASRNLRASRHRAFLIATIAFISYAYFYQGGGWNQNSRFDLVRAITERHTLSIDAYHSNTQDKAFAKGHYYSDKAPGVAFLAVPIALATRPALRVTGVDPESPRGLLAISYFATVCTIALPMAAACGVLFLICLRLGTTTNASAFAALAMGLATPMWAYSTLFWGHALAGACLVFAFAAALKLAGSSHEVAWAIAAGLAAGWATVTEYPTAPASLIIALFALSAVWHDGWTRRLRVIAGVTLGALPCVALLLIYHHAAFGSAFRPSYSYYPVGAFPWMKHGYMGLTYPRIDVALKLLFNCRRGLLFTGPVVLAAPFGLRWLWKNPAMEGAAAGVIAIAVYYFLFNASFPGVPGWSYGPRYLSPSLPLLCVGLAPIWDHTPHYWRKSVAALAISGGLFTFMAVSTTPQPPDGFVCPMFQFIAPSFWTGQLSLNVGSMLTTNDGGAFHAGAFNIGEIVGFHGLPSLLPLVGWWISALLLWKWMNHQADSPRAAGQLVKR
jgi:4-amino-4-deoxy-L-arabinose transferase-like glycosyltransferase